MVLFLRNARNKQEIPICFIFFTFIVRVLYLILVVGMVQIKSNTRHMDLGNELNGGGCVLFRHDKAITIDNYNEL